jgi:hypothetical protein
VVAPSPPTDGGNAQVAMSIDVDRFWDLTLDTYQRVAQAMGR